MIIFLVTVSDTSAIETVADCYSYMLEQQPPIAGNPESVLIINISWRCELSELALAQKIDLSMQPQKAKFFHFSKGIVESPCPLPSALYKQTRGAES